MFILIFIHLLTALAATLPPQVLEVTTNTTLGGNSNSPPPAIRLPSTIVRRATRQLIEHDCTLLIRYRPHVPLPPSHTTVLTSALTRIESYIEQYGEDTFVRYGFDQRIGNVALVAAANRHGPEELLTWGILYEGVAVLQGRSFPMFLGVGLFKLRQNLWR